MKWNKIINKDYDTYPNEGIDVLVSDGINYDVAYFVMSGSYYWLKADLINDEAYKFKAFIIKKWTYIE